MVMGSMNLSKGEMYSILGMGAIFVFTQLLALAISTPMLDAGYQAFKDPNDPLNPIFYMITILIFTGVILLMVKAGKKNLIKGLILFASCLAMYSVLLLPYIYLFWYMAGTPSVISDALINLMNIAALATAIILTYILYKFPEWYVVNTLGIMIGAGVTSILGISLGILPILILLIGLAIYDAIAVYKTKHMIALADVVTEQHLPVLLVMPKSKNYSFRKQKGIQKSLKKKKKIEAMFMGLGDIIIPGSLAVSAYTFTFGGPGFESGMVALATIFGGLAGFILLMRYVMKGNPQAGLPLLNTGAILGFALGYVVFSF